MKETLFYLDINNNSIHESSTHEGCKPFVVPTQKHEDWKYTSFKKILQPAFREISNNQGVKSSDWQDNDFITLTIKNGKVESQTSPILHIEVDEILAYKSTMLPDLLKQNNTTISFKSEYCKIRIVHVLTDTSKLISSNLKIVVTDSQKITIIEEYAIPNESLYFTHLEVQAAKRAHINHYVLQDMPVLSNLVTKLKVNIAEHSTYNHNMVTLDGNIIRNESEIEINGENAELNLYGAYILKGNSHVDNRTKVIHLKPNSRSNELYKGILNDKSTGVFNGRIYVHQDAQKTQAYQSNKNILMSDEAQVYSQPQLEIFADDVKCSHGATSAQIEDSELFYLRARGISMETAKAFLVYAFAEAALENIECERFKQFLDKKIAYHLNQPYL
jgi:Fe-S cluster assembly protein SufD